VIYEAHEAREWAEDNESYDPEHHIEIKYKIGSRASILTWCFNSLFAEALNKRDEGEVDYLVLQHSDIVPQYGWANELYKRMKARGDVAISAVVPLKDHERSKTSTAIGVRGEPYNFRRYVHTSDRLRMPETFGTREVAQESDEILLINSGLLMADLSWPGWDGFHFEFRDEIRRNPDTGKWQAWTSSEDWNFSRYLDKHGASYSATWMPLRHVGMDYWDSFEAAPVSRAAELSSSN
jgi:hypothetical protein